MTGAAPGRAFSRRESDLPVALARMPESADFPIPSRSDCAAVIVCYRTPGLAIRAAEALEEQSPDVLVAVLDNGSADGSAARLADWAEGRSGVVFLASPENLGFGAGCNRGIDAVLERNPDVRHVLLVNPDAVPAPGMLDALRETAADHPEAGAIGGRVLTGDGRSVWYENGRYRPLTLGRSHVPAPAGETDFDTEFITGALMLVDAGLLRDGLRFDERFFLYVEDLDFCREIRARGRTLRVNVRATATHDEGASQAGEAADRAGLRRRQLYYLTRNKVLFARKRLGLAARLVFYAVAFVGKPLAGLARYRGVGFLGTYYRALFDGVRGRGGPMP